MSTKGRENWEKYKAGYVSTRMAEEVSTGNAGRDRWNELKKTIRFDKPESTQNVVSGSGVQKDKKFDTGQYAEDVGKLFLNGVAEGVAATGAAVENWIGKGLDKLFPGAGFEGSGLFNVLYNGRPDWKWAGENGLVGIKQDRKYNQESLQENAERIDGKVIKKAAEFGGDIAYGLGNAAPMAATAMATGGASAAAALTKEGLLKTGAEVVEKSGVLNSMSQAARDMLTSRDYWTSFASEVGMDYYDALDSGATEDEALRYALSSAGLNSVIEIGGGIQKIPEKPTFRTWLKSAHEEGMEEIQQGVVSRLLENVVYNKGNPIASVTDENAVLNPVTALGEYAGGAAVGGILSGGQQALGKVAGAKAETEWYKNEYGDQTKELLARSEELTPGNALAGKLREKVDAGKDLSGGELKKLIRQNAEDAKSNDRAWLKAMAAERLAEYGEVDSIEQVADAVKRQVTGEKQSPAGQSAMRHSLYGERVANEIAAALEGSEDYNSGWMERGLAMRFFDGVGTSNRAASGASTITGAKYNAETGKLDAIVKDDQGKINTVPAEKAELSPLQEELFDWAADLGEAGPVLVSAYRQTQNLETYARQFHNAFEYGKAGVPMDYVNKSQAVSYLNTTQREIAYEEGVKAHQRELQGRQEKKRSGGTVDSSTQKKPTVSLRGATVGGVKYAPVNKKAMDGRQWASVGTMKAFAQATGVNVVFYESQANERGEYEGANGFYKNGTLYLDINAGRDRVAMGETAILKTAAHEITHYIKEGSPEQYEVLKNFVVSKLTREKGISFDDLVTDKQRREPGLSYEEAVDEVVADACEMMLKDSKAVEQLARENRSLAERIRQWIRKWVRSLKAAMEGLTADRPESRAMMQYAQELQEIWDNALVDAVRNGRGTVETDTRLQASPRKKYWRPDLTENEWRLLERRMRKEIGSRENILDEATKWVYANEKGVQVFALYGVGDGTDATPLYAVGGEKAATAADDMQKFVNGGYRYDKGTGTALSRIGGFLRTQGDGSGDIRETSRGRSAGADDALYGGERKGNAGKPAERSSENQRKVKEKFSMRDSVGRELTEAQQEYFKDSKVRDAEGKLKPVYHGSAAIFTKFSADFMSQNGSSEGQGFYFTDYKPMAQGYEKNGGQLLEGYLDIKKPLSDSEVTLTAAEVKQLIKAVDPTGDDLVLNYDSRGGIGYPSRAWYNRSVEDTLRATMSTSESDSEILAELANGMGNPGKVLKTVRELLGYDGYIVESKYDNATVYVAFDSSQFKNADNKTPTADPDIRYQQRELRLSDRAVLLWAAEKAMSERSKRWSIEDLNRFDILVKKLKGLDEAYAELEALKEERTVQLAGRKESELKNEERFELNQTKNRIQTQKDKIQRLEADTYRIESIPQMKELLRKSRSIVEAEAAYKARREYIERREEQEMRRKVERNAKRLTEYMTTNTDKKHIPEALKKPIGELLESLDFSAKKSGRTTRADLKYIEAMQDLQAALAAQRLFDDTGEGTDLFKGYMDLPAGFESLLAVHVEKVKNALEKHPLKTGLVRAMDIDDLKELDVILSVMSRSVTRMNEMFVNRRFAMVSEAAENSIDTMSELGQHQDKTGERFMLWDNTLPWYAFQRFGEGGKAVFEGLQDGWDKLAFNMKTVLDFRKDLIKDALARKWDTEKHRVELTDPDGATVTAVLTTAQLMSLHCLSKRKQALGHLLGGGIRPSAIELTDSIGDRIKKRSLNQDKQFKLTEESLAHLLGLLTPEQVKIADAMQKFMTEQGSLWGNEVTMIRFGYRGFTEQNYFPIETDAQDRQAKTGDTKDGSLYRLQNISAVKPLVKNANNALVLRGIFDVFANHTADMAKYNALVLPILDAQKWYNYKYASKNEAGQVSTRTVQRAMTKAYGGAANNYVIKYLQDLNGVKESGDRGDTLAKKMISNYKRAMVAANMRVALLQPTAYARASAVLDYEYLAKAFADKTSTKQATEEMLQHSGIALWKSLGFFDTDVGRSIRDQIKGKSSKTENFVDKTMVPAEKGDEITWARLWRACKLEVQDKQKLTGDELLKATAERFREVVYRTQVVDSTMTRSHTMRSNGTLSKMATSFMSEPTVSYNMVMESTRQTVGDAKRMGMRVAIRRNWKALGRSLQAYVMSAAVTAIVESLYDALRDPDDDEYMEKVWKAFGGEKPETAKDQVLSIIFGLNGNFAGNINPIGKVPYLRDVVSILGGYSNGRMDTEAVANLKKAIDIWDEVIRLQTGDLDKATKTTYYGNMTTYGMIYPTAKALSQLTGLPGSAAMREVATAWNTTVGTVWPALKMRTYEDKKLREAWENYGKDSGVSYAVMYRAIQDLKEFESDRDADGNAISGSLKAKYVEYIRGMGLTRAQEKAVWEAAKNSSWSDKGTPWG